MHLPFAAFAVSLFPLGVELFKYEKILQLAQENKKTKSMHIIIAEVLKFVLIVAILFVYLLYTQHEKVSIAIVYCSTFMLAQVVGAIVYNIELTDKK